MSDAEATVRSVLIDGLSRHAHLTGLVAGEVVDLLIEDLLAALCEEDTRWAVRALLEEKEVEA